MSEITDSLRRAERLQAEIEQLDRETGRRGRVRRAYSNVVGGILLVVLLVLAVDGWFAYHLFR